MKSNTIYHLAIILASVFVVALSSCSSDEPDDVIWDFAPIIFKIEVEDDSGNIIDAKSEEWSRLTESMSIEYDGCTYTSREDTGLPYEYEPYNAKPHSRDLPPIFKGLYYTTGIDNVFMYFGEFRRNEDYTIVFKINWPDGTCTDVKFENKFKWKNKEPEANSKLWLDGKIQQNSYLLHHRLIN